MARGNNILIILISFLILSSFSLSAKGTHQYELHVYAVRTDSIVLTLFNNTSEPAYLFDSYFTESDQKLLAYMHRYDSEKDIIKLSYLPFQQFTILPFLDDKRMVVYGKGNYLRGRYQSNYSFTKIEAGDSLLIFIPTMSLLTDQFFYDVDLKKYTFCEMSAKDDNDDNKPKKNIKLKRVKNNPDLQNVLNELSVYKDIELFLEYNIFKTLSYRYIRFAFSLRDLDNAASSYVIVSCNIDLHDIIKKEYNR